MRWAGGLKFEGTGSFGHKIVTDVTRESGGDESGYRPTELLLWGIAACTGVDVIRILQKQRQELSGIDIEVIGHTTEAYPKRFHTIEVHFTVTGHKLDRDKVGQAIALSHDKYCSVGLTVIHPTELTTSFEVVEGAVS
jgi:putative redox protein